MDIGEAMLGGLMKKDMSTAVVSIVESTTKHVKIMHGKIDSIVSSTGTMAYLFAEKDKRIMVTNTEDLTDASSARAAVESLSSNIAIISPKDYYYGIADGPFKYPTKLNHDPSIQNDQYSVEDMVSETVGAAMDGGASDVHGMLSLSSSNFRVLSSGSIDASGRSTTASNSIRVYTKHGVSAQSVAVSRTIAGLGGGRVGEDAARIADITKGKGKVENGKYDIILSPIAAGNLVSLVGEAASITSVEAGFSFLSGRQGEKIGRSGLSVYDDATLPDGIGSHTFDDEGVPGRRTALIKDGVFQSYLHNTSTARKYKTETTANAGLLGPDPSNTVLEHKNRYRTEEELISEVKKGILVTNTWYTRFSNYLTGEFSTVPRDAAFYIENGEIKYAISMGSEGSASTGIRINDSFPRMLSNIAAVGGDTVQANAWDAANVVFTPSILVRDVKVTTASFI